MSDPRCWRRPGSSPPLADPAITVVSLIATGDGDLACDDSFVPPRDRPRIHAGRQFRVLGAGTCRSPHHKTGADCGPASPKRARPRPRRKRRPTDRHPTRTPRQQHSAPVPHTRRRNMPEPTPQNRRREGSAGPAPRNRRRSKRSAAQPTGASPKRSAPNRPALHALHVHPGSSTRRRSHRLGAGTCRSPHHETGAEKGPPNPQQQCATQAAMETTANRPALHAHSQAAAGASSAPPTRRAPASYERPNGSSPAGRGAAGPYPTTLARSAAQNSAGCSITLGTSIR